MFFKPKMLLFIILAALLLLGAIAGLIIGVAGLLGGKWVYAFIGFTVFGVFWSGKLALERNDKRIREMIHGS
ncbi:MAG: hypothetical protein ACRBC3_20240 [Burkholderiaceae bacterium]